MNLLSNKLNASEELKPRSGRFPISASVLSGIAVAVDSIVILGTGALVYFQMINANANTSTQSIYVAAICSIWITTLMLFHYSELYRFEAIVRPLENLDKIFISFATGILFLLAAAFALEVSEAFSRIWVGAFGLSALASTLVAKILLSRAVLNLSRHGVFSRNMVIAGNKENVSRLLDRLTTTRPEFVNVTALFVDGPSNAVIGGQPVVGDLSDIPAFARSFRVDDVVIAMPWSAEQEILELVEQLQELPVNVYLGSDLIGLRLDFRQPPDHFNRTPIFSIVGNPISGWGVAIKAIENYVLAIVFLAVAAVPMMLIALLIKLDSPGPALFRQQRLGFNNRVFSIYKFRTMRHTDRPEKKTAQATQSDPRVTRIGRFLRRSSLDELPQLFNVLEGTMSLVGPRPHAVDHNEEYARKIRGYFGRHRVKPGITGWAQVNGLRGETDTPDKMEARVRYDVFYTENWSLLFDLRILLRTVRVLITGQNAH